MGLKGFIHLKLQVFRLRRLLIGNGKRKKRQVSKPSWMTSISHGYHVFETKWYRGELDSAESDYDSVVVQREQFDDVLELWFFEISDSRIGDGVTKLMQSHFFDQKPKSQIRRKCKEAMKKAYIGVRAKIIREIQKEKNETLISKAGSVCVMVINGEKLVIANIGDYKAILCRNGVAHKINGKSKQHHSAKRLSWPRRLISGRTNIVKSTPYKCSELVVGVGTERVDYYTEFLVLASSGIWEVMKPQEAVDLISHLEDPQEAAECLAREAINRVSKNNISCVVIRFD